MKSELKKWSELEEKISASDEEISLRHWDIYWWVFSVGEMIAERMTAEELGEGVRNE